LITVHHVWKKLPHHIENDGNYILDKYFSLIRFTSHFISGKYSIPGSQWTPWNVQRRNSASICFGLIGSSEPYYSLLIALRGSSAWGFLISRWNIKRPTSLSLLFEVRLGGNSRPYALTGLLAVSMGIWGQLLAQLSAFPTSFTPLL
jgi:hypothetical protein